MKEETVPVTVRWDKPMQDALLRYAAENDLTVSQIVRRALREFLANHKNEGN